MYYLGQIAYSESLEGPVVYLGRKLRKDKLGNIDGYLHLVFADNDVIEDWELCDLNPFVTPSGAIFKGDEEIGLLTGYLEVKEDNYERFSLYLNEVAEKIKNKRIKPLMLAI